MTKDERTSAYMLVIVFVVILVALVIKVVDVDNRVLNSERADRAATATAEVQPAE